MNKIIVVILIFLFHSVNAQVEKDIAIFHRLLILNSQNELMVVNIENTDFWVTPGLYQTKKQHIKTGLDSIASTYGIELKNLKLHGTFLLQRELYEKHSTSLRIVYSANIKVGKIELPYGIAEVKWLSKNKAMELISFPHINMIIEKIMTHPDEIWGGTLLQFKENDNWKAKILEEFYTL